MSDEAGARIAKDNSALIKQAILKGAKRGLNEVADRIIDQAVQRVPVDRGKLQESIDKKPIEQTPNSVSVEVGAYSPYAAVPEFGSAGRGEPDAPGKKVHGPYPIRPKKRKSLRFKNEKGKYIQRKKVMHPGIAPQPYFRPALDVVMPQINRIVSEEINKELNKTVGKHT